MSQPIRTGQLSARLLLTTRASTTQSTTPRSFIDCHEIVLHFGSILKGRKEPAMEHKPSSSALFDVFLRLRPSTAGDRERFLDVETCEGDYAPTHITIHPPADDKRKRAIEKFAFTRVFEEHAGQRELLDEIGAVNLLEGVLGARGREGRDGLLATLGVTGSGKVSM